MKKNLMFLIFVCILAGVAVYQNFAGASLPTEEAPEVDYLAPSFSLQSLNGNAYRVGGARDKALLINFWAAWCEPCDIEAPELQKLYEKYKDRLDIYAVDYTVLDNLDEVKKFVDRHRLTFPILLDKRGSISELYQVYSFPTNVYIDKNGVVRDITLGVISPQEMEGKIKSIIK